MDNQECWDVMGDDDGVLVDMVRDIVGALDENAQEDRDQEREGYNDHGQELVNGGGNGNGTEVARADTASVKGIVYFAWKWDGTKMPQTYQALRWE